MLTAPKSSTRVDVIETPDGSRTLRYHGSDVAFRSVRGAATESKYVFVDGTNIHAHAGPWKVLELGFGGALNFMETASAMARAPDCTGLVYHAVEYNPIPTSVFDELYEEADHDPTITKLVRECLVRAADVNAGVISVHSSHPKVELHLHIGSWQTAVLDNFEANGIYHDPFAPRDNPACWTDACFRWEAGHLEADGVMTTYSAATSIRRAMVQAGLFVAKREGACGKREMTAAALNRQSLDRFKLLPASKQPAVEDIAP